VLTNKPSLESRAIPVTAVALAALKADLDKLIAQKTRLIPDRLRASHQYGSGSGNDEYLAVLEEEGVLDARIARLEDILSRAETVDPATSNETVAIGCRVTLLDKSSGTTMQYAIASAHADTPPGSVSAASPVGAALLGRRPGESVTVTLPGGHTRELEVIAISHGLP
jgi:transcription elongation factor GreA